MRWQSVYRASRPLSARSRARTSSSSDESAYRAASVKWERLLTQIAQHARLDLTTSLLKFCDTLHNTLATVRVCGGSAPYLPNAKRKAVAVVEAASDHSPPVELYQSLHSGVILAGII